MLTNETTQREQHKRSHNELIASTSSVPNAVSPWAQRSDVLDFVLALLPPNLVDVCSAMRVCKAWRASLSHAHNWHTINMWTMRKTSWANHKGLETLISRSTEGVGVLLLEGCRNLKKLPKLPTVQHHLRSLTVLSLKESCLVSPTSITEFLGLCISLNAPLHTLDLSWCHFFGDGHAERLSPKSMPAMRILRVRGTLLGDGGFEKLFEAMPNLEEVDAAAFPYTRLRNINVVGNKTCTAATQLPNLRVIKFCGRRSVTIEGVTALLESQLAQLSRIDIRHCPKIADEELRRLCELRPTTQVHLVIFSEAQQPSRSGNVFVDVEVGSEAEVELCDEGDPVKPWFSSS